MACKRLIPASVSLPTVLAWDQFLSLPATLNTAGGEEGCLCSLGRPRHTGEVAMPAQFPLSPGTRGEQLAVSRGAPGLLQRIRSHSISAAAGPRWRVQVRGVACMPVL